jgi:methylsterol monooxygenase
MDPKLLVVWGTVGITTLIYWIYSLVLMPFDLLHLMHSSKIQRTKHVDVTLHWKCAKQVLFNQVFVNVPLAYGLYYLNQWRNSLGILQSLPTPSEFLQHLVVFIVLEEIGFYYTHRLGHHPALYRHIHKQHHLFTAPIGMAATYAHPIEHLVSNMLPLAMGPIVMKSHLVTIWIWFSLAIFNTINSHCGYDFFGFPSSLMHDFHHYSFNSNFGVVGVLDYIHGTDSGFQTWLETYAKEKWE